MNIKEEIGGLLNRLKANGHTREAIEKELNYSPNYIDQVLAKGGNKRFLNTLQKYGEKVLQKETFKAMQEKEPLETAIENLSESKLIDSKNIARLINLLELKLGVKPDMSMFPEPGTPASETLTKKINSGKP